MMWNFGKWKIEDEFVKARYIRQKTYIHQNKEGKLKITCAGLPSRLYPDITWENFHTGLVLFGKLQPKIVRGRCNLRGKRIHN